MSKNLDRNICDVRIPVSIHINKEIRIYYGDDYYVLGAINYKNNRLLVAIIKDAMDKIRFDFPVDNMED